MIGISESMEATAKSVAQSTGQTEFTLLKQDLTKGSPAFKRFEAMLGAKAPQFVASIISSVSRNPDLLNCSHRSIIASALVAAFSNVSLDANLGQAALVPYKGKATFQMMKNGFVTLALRTGLVRTLNVATVYEGDIADANPLTGECVYNSTPHPREIIVGYMAYIKLHSGFEKYCYWTLDELKAHGMRYSKSYDTGLWTTNPTAMYEKTVVKDIVKKWCPIDLFSETGKQLGVALKYDQATPTAQDANYTDVTESDAEYPDGVNEKEQQERLAAE